MTNPRKEALEYGIDLTLTQANLELTVEERLIQHQRALYLVEALKQATKVNPSDRSQFTS